ncbi:MAG: glycosyltransferase, partial [Pseudomonadota bacterium]
MRILHIVASIENEAAGPSVSVPRLAEAQRRHGADVHIATIGDPAAPHPQRTTVPHHRFKQDYENAPILSRFQLSSGLRQEMSSQPLKYDVVHSHGLWLAPNVYPAIAAKSGVQWVVSPRGMLGADALKFSALKKKLFWHFLQRPALKHASLIHATSPQEAQEAMATGIEAPCAIVPNGVDVPPLTVRHEETNTSPQRRRSILSLGRIHPKKGLDRLVRAWAQVQT